MPPADFKPNWPRINRGKVLCHQIYPGVVGTVLAAELDSWGNFGFRLGGQMQIDRLLDHLELRERAGEDIGVIVHRVEVEG